MPSAGAQSPLPSPPRHSRRTLPTTFVDESVAAAAALLDRWHPDDSACSLFLDSPDEAGHFLRAAADLHRAMLFFASEVTNVRTGGQGLVHAQALLDTAMQRLQLELQLLLSALPNTNAAALVDFHHDDDHNEQQAIGDHLRAVAEAMMAAGYGKECVSTFKARRRAALAGALQRLLGFSPSVKNAEFNKLTWDQVDAKVQSWLAGASAAFVSVFPAERELCDSVFSGDTTVGDAVFAAIANDQATSLLAVAEAAVARARRAPERLFRVLDVHDALTETILPAIVSVFGDKSEVTSRAVALAMTKVGEAARSIVASFEAAIQKEPSKATAPGGAVHPLTRYVMNYLVFLADYENALAHIYQQGAEFVDTSAAVSGRALPDLSSSSSSPSSSSSLSLSSNPIGWLVFVLLRKLDAKAGGYRDAALSYLFLANNTHYVAKKVEGSGKLEGILGEEWAEVRRAKARGCVDAYVRAAWGSKVVAASRGGGGEGVEQAVTEAVAAQERWVAADEEMGEALRKAARAAVVPAYRLFYRRHGAAVRLTPGDVNAMIGGLFGGSTTSPDSVDAIAGESVAAAAGRRQLQVTY